MGKREIVKVSSEVQLRQQAYINEVRQLNDEFYHDKGSKKKAMIVTYGCQMNEHDSEKLAGMLNHMGYVETNEQAEADLIIYNTCCVRENAELKVYGNLGQLKHLKKVRPDMIIAVCGCMMQQAHIVDQIKKKYSHVDLVFGTHNLHNFPELLANCKKSDHMLVEVWDEEGTVVEGVPVIRKYGLKAFVNIMYGCNNFCTYCIVPYTRGRERSRDPYSIVAEAQKLFDEGYREVTLLGQNVDSYKWSAEVNNKVQLNAQLKRNEEVSEVINFAKLLEKVALVSPELRIRFSTSHPKDITDEVLHVMKTHENICKCIHLPVQSGNSRVLKLMNRTYDREWYINRVDAIRNILGDTCAISSDMIAGFCSETEEEHQETISIMDYVKYDFSYMFYYSERPGTLAAKKYEDDIPLEVKKRRLQEIINKQHEVSLIRNKMDIGETYRVLIEGTSKRSDQQLQGRNSANKVVIFDKNEKVKGEYVNVKITECTHATLFGKIV